MKNQTQTPNILRPELKTSEDNSLVLAGLGFPLLSLVLVLAVIAFQPSQAASGFKPTFAQSWRQWAEKQTGQVKLEVFSTSHQLRLRIPADFLFQTDSVSLKADALEFLKKFAQNLRNQGRPFRVECVSQKMPNEPPEQIRNLWEFNSFRAVQITRFLSTEMVPAQLMQVGGAGIPAIQTKGWIDIVFQSHQEE